MESDWFSSDESQQVAVELGGEFGPPKDYFMNLLLQRFY